MAEPQAQSHLTNPISDKTGNERMMDGGHDQSLNDHQQSLAEDSFHLNPEEFEEKAQPTKNPWSDPSSFPDGGKTAWLTVAGASACLFVSFGWINCIGVFQDYYQTHQLREYTPSTVAWIPSLQRKSGNLYRVHV